MKKIMLLLAIGVMVFSAQIFAQNIEEKADEAAQSAIENVQEVQDNAVVEEDYGGYADDYGEEYDEEYVEEFYTCPNHPEILEDQPGKCPICGADLVKLEDTGDYNEEEVSY